MKQYSRYVTYLILVLLLVFLQMNTISDDLSEVKAFRGGTLEDEVFEPMIAKSINEENKLKFSVDGKEMPLTNDCLFVDSKMNLLGSLSFIRDTYSCSARLYQNSDIKIQRGRQVLRLKVNSLEATLNNDAFSLTASPIIEGKIAYVPLSEISQLFGFGYEWNEEKLTLSLDTKNAGKATLPDTFDLRNEERVSSIRNQGNESTCWAYAAIGALESSLLPESANAFSPNDLIDRKGYSYIDRDGGDFSQAAAYFLSWKGPKSDKSNSLDYHVQGLKFFDSDDIDSIKWAIFKDGGVSTSIYIDNADENMAASKYYNPLANAYCYTGQKEPNHDVVIIGWDDDFPKEKFNGHAIGNGAFICQNSWGSSFGENGVFYVSYYDTNVGDQSVSYFDIESSLNYDEIYQSDLYGWTGQIGYQKENVLGANVFTAKTDMSIKAAGFYALDKQSFYELYFVPEFTGVDSLSNRTLVASGSLNDAGYYTIPFTTEALAEAGKKFAIILSITTPGSTEPMAIEYKSERIDGDIDITDGTSYISKNGIKWESVEENFNANICLKAYGDYDDPEE